MEVFKQSSRIFILHCYLPPTSTNKWKHYGCMLYTALFVIDLLLSGASSLCFLIESYYIDKESAFCGLYQIVLVAGPLYSFVVAQFTKEDIQNNFTAFQRFYDKNKVMDPLGYMRKAEMRSRRMVNIFLSFVVICDGVHLVNCFGSLLYHRIQKGVMTDYSEVHRPYRYVLPWDQTTFNGWLYELMFSIFLPIHYFVISAGFVTLLVTICEYHRSFCKIIDFHLTNIDKMMQSGTYRHRDLINMFRETVTFHFEAKQLFLKSADLFSYFIASELIQFMLLMTFLAFLLDYAARHVSLDFFLMFMGVFYVTVVLYLYCYNGQDATDSYAAIADHLYESDWMNAPVALQRMYVLMIAHAQKELHYRGFGIVDLNVENFLKIIKSVVGYVLMFKTLAEQDA